MPSVRQRDFTEAEGSRTHSTTSDVVNTGTLAEIPKKGREYGKSIKQISFFEDEMIQLSEEKYKEYFHYPNNALSLLLHFVENVNEKGYVFILFLTQFQNSMYLSMLSTLSRHDIQAMMILRYALESSVLAAYGLTNTNIYEFVKTDK